MTLLPIAARELRVAARKRSTFGVRIIAALVAFVIGCGFLLLSLTGMGGTPINLGHGLFSTVSWLCLAAALASGLFLTSDCLSEEKREGTLGFLFLTDLRGFDVVLGKLLATSLRGTYALLAVLPVLALTLVMGGVSGGEFWRTALSLLNALFLSLAAGLFVSALSRDSQKALAATFFLLVLLVAGGPAVDAGTAWWTEKSFVPRLSLASSGFLLVQANGFGSSSLWLPTLLVNQISAWTFLIAACWLLPRVWQEKSRQPSQHAEGWSYRWKFGGVKYRRKLRAKFLERCPVLWLACRERWQAASIRMLLLAFLVGYTSIYFYFRTFEFWLVWSWLGGLLSLAFYIAVASQSVRFFVEARRGGLLELLLSTPLTARAIVQSQWRALVRMFAVPVGICLLLQSYGAVQSQRAMMSQVTTSAPAVPVVVPATNNLPPSALLVSNAVASATVTNGSATFTMTNGNTTTTVVASSNPIFTVFGSSALQRNLMVAITIVGKLASVLEFVALAWFGMWMGLNSRTANLATLKTILFVLIIPAFAVSFLSAMIIPLMMLPNFFGKNSGSPPRLMEWFPVVTSLVAILLTLAKDIGFLLWSKNKLGTQFREHALRVVAPVLPVLPPPLPAASAPPVIAAR